MSEPVDLGADAEIIKKYWNPKPEDVCLDIGSGPGHWTLRALELGAFVYAFDPAFVAVESLIRDVRKHGFVDVAIVPVALWDSVGMKRFVRDNVVFDDDKANAEDSLVPVTTVDQYFRYIVHLQEHSVRTVKMWINMDCEGAELRVLKGALQTVADYAPHFVIEVHQGVSRDELREMITQSSESRSMCQSEKVKYTFIDDAGFLIATPS